MKKLISFESAVFWARIIFGIFMLFHLAIIIGIVAFDFTPVDFLWGGRMQTKEDLLSFEFISLILMTICYLIVWVRSQPSRFPGILLVTRIILWILTFLFLLNTLGNILAVSTFEKFFAIVTVALAFLNLRLALEPIRQD